MTPPITFTPPLPCSAVGADGVGRCGKDATVGTLYPIGNGQFIVQPFCLSCVTAMQQIYPYVEQSSTTPEKELEQ